MKRKKITITKLTVVELITQSEDQVFILYISAYQFPLAYSAQFNLSSSILATPSGEHSNATVVATSSSCHPPCRQDHSVKDHFNAEDKKSTGKRCSFKLCSLSTDCLLRALRWSGGRNLLNFSISARSFCINWLLFSTPSHNPLIYNDKAVNKIRT